MSAVARFKVDKVTKGKGKDEGATVKLMAVEMPVDIDPARKVLAGKASGTITLDNVYSADDFKQGQEYNIIFQKA